MNPATYDISIAHAMHKDLEFRFPLDLSDSTAKIVYYPIYKGTPSTINLNLEQFSTNPIKWKAFVSLTTAFTASLPNNKNIPYKLIITTSDGEDNLFLKGNLKVSEF